MENALREDACAKTLSRRLRVCASSEGAAGQVHDDHIRADPLPHKVELQISAAYFFVSNIK